MHTCLSGPQRPVPRERQRRSRMGAIAVLFLFAAPQGGLAATHGGSLVATIGTNPECTVQADAPTPLAQAMLAGGRDLRIQAGVVLTESLNLPNFNEGLRIAGGYASCADASADQVADPQARSTWHLLDQGSRLLTVSSVLTNGYVQLVRMRLEDLVVTPPASASQALGGAILAQGELNLDLRSSEIEGFSAQLYGGGVALTSGALAVLVDTTIASNRAANGGGIACLASGVLIDADSRMLFNRAVDDGVDPTYGNGGALLGDSCGVGLFAAALPNANGGGMSNNGADRNGGAIHLRANSSLIAYGGTQAMAGTAGPFRPVLFQDNYADFEFDGVGSGGALSIEGGFADLRQVVMLRNEAESGGALFVSGGAEVRIGDPFAGPTHYECWSWWRCNALDSNRASLVGTDTTGGGAVHLIDASLTAYRTRFSSNAADLASVARLEGSALLQLESSTIAGNGDVDPITQDLTTVSLDNQSTLKIDLSTVANNSAVLSGFVALSTSSMRFDRSILREQGNHSIVTSAPGTLVSGDCNLSDASLGNGIGSTVVADPGFVDEAQSDYRLAPTSPAIDLCEPPVDPIGRDMKGERRGLDRSGGAVTHVFDAGSDESYTLERLFADGFLGDND